MPIDESFPSEEPRVEMPVAEQPVAEAIAPEPVAEQPIEEVAVEAPAEVPVEEVPVAEPPVAETPVFDEKAWLKQFGDDVETPAQLKERLEGYKANQLTEAQKGQLALLDPANKDKFAAFAALAGKDYDALDYGQALKEEFALKNPGMPQKVLDYRFQSEFKQKYPTLAAALANPDEFEADDQQVAVEKDAADYDALQAKAALKAHQETTTQKFFTDAASTASKVPEPTAEQKAEALAFLKWSDETFTEGATLPIDLGKGATFNMPIGDAASFKEGLLNVDSLYMKQALTAEGKPNKEMQATIALFLRDPKGFVASIANAVKSSQPPSIPVADLTNSPASKAAKPAAKVPAEANPSYQNVYADDWLNSNA